MTFEAESADLMSSQVTIAPFASYDSHGGPTYGTAKTLQCRVEARAQRATSQEGREVVSHTTIIGKPTFTDGSAVAIGLADKITLPAGFSPQTPPIINVQPCNDDQGFHHVEVLL